MQTPLTPGHYYLTPTWEFKYALTLEEAQKQNPLKIWKVTLGKEYDKALEEAGFIRMNTEHTNTAKITIA